MKSERILSEFNWALSFNRTNVEGPLKDSDLVRVTLEASEWWQTQERLFITVSGELILSAATLGRKWKNICSCRTERTKTNEPHLDLVKGSLLCSFSLLENWMGKEREQSISPLAERNTWIGVSLKQRRQLFPIMFAVLLFCCPGD